MNPGKILTSDDYKTSTTLLAAKIAEIVRTARERGWTPPFELHIAGSDDDEVAHILIDQDAKMQSLTDRELTDRCPLTAMLTDAADFGSTSLLGRVFLPHDHAYKTLITEVMFVAGAECPYNGISMFRIQTEERLASLIAATGAIWTTYEGTKDFAGLLQFSLLPLGPVEVCAIGILIWLHAKWRRSAKVG